MSNLDIEMRCLKEDVKSLYARMIVERDVADYWYKRCQELEAKLNVKVLDEAKC